MLKVNSARHKAEQEGQQKREIVNSGERESKQVKQGLGHVVSNIEFVVHFLFLARQLHYQMRADNADQIP